MSEPVEQHVPTENEPEQSTAAPETSPAESTVSTPEREASLADTAGTGTIVALGCIGGTVFLIVLGLIYLLITQVFG